MNLCIARSVGIAEESHTQKEHPPWFRVFDGVTVEYKHRDEQWIPLGGNMSVSMWQYESAYDIVGSGTYYTLTTQEGA